MLRIAVLSVGRSDYGLYHPLLSLLTRDADTRTTVIAGGAHLLASHGNTVSAIRADGFDVIEADHAADSDGALETAQSVGRAMIAFAREIAAVEPDIVLVLGDRYEMFAGAAAAYTLRIPLVHIHGGEVTFGAMDEGYRHAITKLSHIHFAATASYARRILQMGEEPWRVHVSGSPTIDALLGHDAAPISAVAERLGLDPSGAILLTYHPATMEPEPLAGLDAILQALETVTRNVIVTAPNADPGNRAIRARLRRWVDARPESRVFVETLGRTAYPAVLRSAAVMMGNSSSGLIEAPSFGLPVINVGTRQEGRIRGRNVIDVAPEAGAITSALQRALVPGFREGLRNEPNPYGDGRAAARIRDVLRGLPDRHVLLKKRFVDASGGGG